jgi:hypothetical protein
MFISAAVILTPENEEQLRPLLEALGLSPTQTDMVREMLALRQLPNGPAISEIARSSDLSAQTVRRLDLRVRPATTRQQYKSAFISYGGSDEAFAGSLHKALLARGVHVYYFPESSIPGRQLHRTMNDAVHEYDVVVSVCSKKAVTRPGWLNELEQTLVREAREGGAELLIPVLLDDYVLTEWNPERKDIARQLRSRVAADFKGFHDVAIFSKQVERLLKALELPTGSADG